MDKKRIAEEQELNALLGKPFDGCAISGCRYDVTQGELIYMKDGMSYPLCSRHWEAMIMILGRQDEGMKSSCPACGSLDPGERGYVSQTPDGPSYLCEEWWHERGMEGEEQKSEWDVQWPSIDPEDQNEGDLDWTSEEGKMIEEKLAANERHLYANILQEEEWREDHG